MAEPLVIGTGNMHKVAELTRILNGTPWVVKSLREFPSVPEPEEHGNSFEENALLKARYYSDHLRLACVADDSGLEVDALGGEPGVYSSRYAGPEGDAVKNMRKLLTALNGVADAARTARFVCCAALVIPNRCEHVERGTVEGRIIDAPRGSGGFGYDPVFVPQPETRTFAEMTSEEKQALSHRGQAFAKLRVYLDTYL